MSHTTSPSSTTSCHRPSPWAPRVVTALLLFGMSALSAADTLDRIFHIPPTLSGAPVFGHAVQVRQRFIGPHEAMAYKLSPNLRTIRLQNLSRDPKWVVNYRFKITDSMASKVGTTITPRNRGITFTGRLPTGGPNNGAGVHEFRTDLPRGTRTEIDKDGRGRTRTTTHDIEQWASPLVNRPRVVCHIAVTTPEGIYDGFMLYGNTRDIDSSHIITVGNLWFNDDVPLVPTLGVERLSLNGVWDGAVLPMVKRSSTLNAAQVEDLQDFGFSG